MVNPNVVPGPVLDWAQSFPSSASTIDRLIGNPIPLPSWFVEKNALKTWSNSSCDRPLPRIVEDLGGGGCRGTWTTVMITQPWYTPELTNYAANVVTWEDAVAYCRKLSRKGFQATPRTGWVNPDRVERTFPVSESQTLVVLSWLPVASLLSS